MKVLKCIVVLGVALVLALTAGCSLVGTGGIEQGAGYLALRVNPGLTPKAVTATEFDVTGVAVDVIDPSGALVETIEWAADDGAHDYLIKVTDQGQYEIVVTHIGEGFELTESVTVELRAMVITTIEIIPGFIGVIGIDPGELSPPLEGINEIAFTAMMGLVEAVGPVSGGGGELPEGVIVDTTGFDFEAGGGTMIFVHSGYQPPGTSATVDGEIFVEMWWMEGDPWYIDEHISGTLALTGLGFDTFAIDLYLTIDIVDDGPDWSTAAWSGTITLDGEEADVDLVMSAYFGSI